VGGGGGGALGGSGDGLGGGAVGGVGPESKTGGGRRDMTVLISCGGYGGNGEPRAKKTHASNGGARVTLLKLMKKPTTTSKPMRRCLTGCILPKIGATLTTCRAR